MSELEMDRISKKLDSQDLSGPDNDIVANTISIKTIERNMRIIAGLTIEQLELFEKDMMLYEKVSLCFLLYGYKYSEVALQKLQIAIQIVNPSQNVFMLAEWVRTISRNDYMAEKWREILIEAMCIAQINHVLLKLGLDLEELNTRFFPRNPDFNLFVHPLLKCLYLLSEHLKIKDSEAMIAWVDRTYIHTSEFFCPGLLELHLLSWINYAIIIIGEWNYGQPNKNMTQFSNVKPMIRYLDENKLLTNFKISLEDVVKRVNYTKNNYITIDKECQKVEKLKQDSDYSSIDTKSTISSAVPTPTDKINLPKSSSATKLQRYEVHKETAGYVLIINQRDFRPNTEKPKESLNTRRGTDFDRDRLIKTFSRHGYRKRICENLTDTEILNEVHRVARDSCKMDSLIVCILSHGKLGTVFSSNNVQVSIEKIKSAMAINELKDKPKMLIVQACQEASNPKEAFDNFDIQPSTKANPECFKNMLTTHSTIDGFVSYRTRTEGTWFIQTLCEMIEKYGEELHISDIFTCIFQEFETKQGPTGERMVPIVTKTFSKNFYLPL